MRSKKVARQLKKAFGDEAIESSLSDGSATEEQTRYFDGLREFVDQVEATYAQLDEKVALAEKSLSVSSEELAQTNQNLFKTNQTVDAMVNSLGQGFLLCGPDGRVLPMASKACEHLLQTNPAGQELAAVLKVPREKHAVFTDWLALLFAEPMDFNELAVAAPRTFPHSEGLVVGLELKPVRDTSRKIIYIVVIATDHTAAFEADRKAQEMHAYASMVVSILKDPDQFQAFMFSARRFFREMQDCLSKENFNAESVSLIKRHVHTLKSSFGGFSFIELKTKVHGIETELNEIAELAAQKAFLKTAILTLHNAFEQKLIEHKDIIGDTQKSAVPKREVPITVLKGFAERLRSLKSVEENLYGEFIEELLCVPVAEVFRQFDSVLTETAKKVNKKVQPLLYRGENVRLVPESYGALWPTLGHIFRNIVDHGIEAEADRISLEKLPAGRVWIDCNVSNVEFDRRPFIEICIHDDGAGIDVKGLRAKLALKNPTTAAALSDQQVMNSIFEPGVSTAQAITELSGRGVGLDAVKAVVESLGGRITVESQRYQGTTFNISLPLFTSFDVTQNVKIKAVGSAA